MVNSNSLLLFLFLRFLACVFDSDSPVFTFSCPLSGEIFSAVLCLQHSESTGLKNEVIRVVIAGWRRVDLKGYQVQNSDCERSSLVLQRVVGCR